VVDVEPLYGELDVFAVVCEFFIGQFQLAGKNHRWVKRLRYLTDRPNYQLHCVHDWNENRHSDQLVDSRHGKTQTPFTNQNRDMQLTKINTASGSPINFYQTANQKALVQSFMIASANANKLWWFFFILAFFKELRKTMKWNPTLQHESVDAL